MKKFFTLAAAALATTAYAAIDSAPESAEVQTWYFNAQVFYPAEEIVNQEIQVAIDGDDLYFTGIYSMLNGWVKGTLSNGVYEFASGQDLGVLWGSYNMNFAGYDGDNVVLATATMEDGVLTFNSGIGILFTDYPESGPQIWWEPGAKLSAEPLEHIEPLLTEQTASLPYKNGFDSETKRDQATIYSPDGLGWDWGADWSTNNWYAACNNDGWTQANDYLIFPGLTLEAGKAYTVHFDAQSSSSSYWQNYEVLMAAGEAKLSNFTEAVMPNAVCYSEAWVNVEKEFEVAETNTYFLAIHCTSYAYNGYFNVDNFVVEEVDPEKPAAVDAVIVTPGSKGALEATIAFSMPSATAAGVAYDSNKVLSYTVTRGEYIVAEGQDKAGALVMEQDGGLGLNNGIATYKVVIADQSHFSKEAEGRAYIGLDYPTETVYIEITAEGNQVTMAWAPVTKGANGGYVGAKYNVYACPAQYSRGEKLNEEPLTACAYTFDWDVESGEQGEAWFCVTAVNDIDESYGAYASLAVGAPYALPFAESFADDAHVWSFGGDGGAAYIDRWGSFCSDGDDAALTMYVWGWGEDCTAVATTGKICTAANAELTFDYMTEANGTLNVELVTGDEDGNVVVTVEPIELEANSGGTVSLPAIFDGVLDYSCVKVSFVACLDATYQYLYIDNVNIAVVDVPTAISSVGDESAAKVFSLDGKLINARPAAGFYIQDGKILNVR